MKPWPRRALTSPGDSLIQRFPWPRGLLRDVLRGSPLERAAAYRHNQAQLGLLLAHTVRWSTILTTLLVLLQIVSRAASGAEPPLVTVLGSALGLGAALCAAVVAVMGATCLYLRLVR